MKKVLLISFLAVACMYSCTHKPFSSSQSVITPTPTPVDSTKTPTGTHDSAIVETVDTSVCFQRDILPLMTGSCAKAGCHDAATRAEGYNLTTYNTIVSKGLVKGNATASKLYKECANGKMPQAPTPKLDSTQMSLLRRWINNGATNDTNCATNCDTTKFTYASAITPIISKYCLSCHASGPAASSGGNIKLDSYDAMYAQAVNGKLLGSLQHATGFSAMPKGGYKMSDCKITQVAKWIAAGAQNN